jgi:hypothetical protein
LLERSLPPTHTPEHRERGCGHGPGATRIRSQLSATYSLRTAHCLQCLCLRLLPLAKPGCSRSRGANKAKRRFSETIIESGERRLLLAVAADGQYS